MNFRTRVAVTAAAAVAVALVLAFVGQYVVTQRTLIGSIDDDLREIANEIDAIDRTVPGGVFGPRGLREFGPRVGRYGGAGGYVQAIVDGELVGPVGEDLPVSDAAMALATQGGSPVLETIVNDDVRLRVLTVPVRSGGAVQVARPLDEVDESLGSIRRRFWLFGIFGVMMAAGLGLTVARRAVRPVEDLTDVAQEVATTTDLTRRIDVAGSDEIARLATTFNAMLASLEQARTAQEQLIADASHELRTPLTSLRTNIEVLADVERLPAAQRRALIDDVVVQLDEFARLISALVELARGDQSVTSAVPTRLDELVDTVVTRTRAFAPDSVRIDVRTSPSVVEAETQRLERAVANLLDNAIKYGDGTPVEIMVEEGRVVVRDHGPGIDPDELGRVFDRFHRAPAARSAPGSGLGLAIVKQVVESHGGTVSAANATDGGAVLTIQLPVSQLQPASV